ncbi:hypothetical protein vseg_009483 [Gypsophila vaccaria]
MSSINRILLLAIFCLVVSQELEVCAADPIQRLIGAFRGARVDCKPMCYDRCLLKVAFRRCFRACNTCCQRCNCVPPGPSGNTAVCPCWNTITTLSGVNKCP